MCNKRAHATPSPLLSHLSPPGLAFACVRWCVDFGPLNLGQVYRFAQKLNAKLSDKRLANKRIYYYSSTHSHKRTNAAFLISAYAMLYLGRTPEDAYRPFRGIYPPFPPPV